MVVRRGLVKELTFAELSAKRSDWDVGEEEP